MKIKRLRKVNESNEIVEAVDQSIFLPISRGGDHGYFTVYGTNRRGDVEALHINKVYARSGDSFTVNDGYDRYRVWKYTNPEDAKKDLEFAQRTWPYGPKWEIAELVKEGRYYVLKDQPTEANESLTEAAGSVRAYYASEHKAWDDDEERPTWQRPRGPYYGYVTIDHPTLGEFTVSVKCGDGRPDVRTDGKPWNFLQEPKYQLTQEQIDYVNAHKKEIHKMAKNDTPTATFKESLNEATSETVYIVVAGRDSKVFRSREAAEKRSKQYDYNVSMSGSNDGYSYVVETTLQ